MRPALSLAALLLGFAVCAPAFAQAPARETKPEPEPVTSEPAEPEPADPEEPAKADPRERPAGPGERNPGMRRERRGPRSFTVTWDAPDVLKKLFEQHLPPPKAEESERRGSTLRPWMRDIRRRVPEIAASEGYFSTAIDVDFADEARSQVIVKVAPGPRTVVDKVCLLYTSDAADE